MRRAVERLFSLGCFLSFKSTFTLSSAMKNVMDSWESYLIHNVWSRDRSRCLPRTSSSPALSLGSICFRPLVREVSGPHWPTWPGSHVHLPPIGLPPCWVSATQVAECRPQTHPGSFIGTSTFASDCVLSPRTEKTCWEVVNQGTKLQFCNTWFMCFHTALTFACSWINHFKLLLAGFLMSTNALNAKQYRPYSDYF